MNKIKNSKRNLKKEFINWRVKFNGSEDKTDIVAIVFIAFIMIICLIVVTGEVGRFATPWIN